MGPSEVPAKWEEGALRGFQYGKHSSLLEVGLYGTVIKEPMATLALPLECHLQ